MEADDPVLNDHETAGASLLRTLFNGPEKVSWPSSSTMLVPVTIYIDDFPLARVGGTEAR